ncbi:hypothetical protein ACVNP0_07720 [Staphylococcus aureus]
MDIYWFSRYCARYLTFAELGNQHITGDLADTVTLTAGLGGMGGAQPLAITMNHGVAICVDVDGTRVDKRIDTKYCDVKTADLDEALKLAEEAKERGEGLSNRVSWKCCRHPSSDS